MIYKLFLFETYLFVLAGLFPEMNGRQRAQTDERIGRFLLADEAPAPPEVQRYLEELAAHRLVDLDDVCRQALALFRKGGRFADRLVPDYRRRRRKTAVVRPGRPLAHPVRGPARHPGRGAAPVAQDRKSHV